MVAAVVGSGAAVVGAGAIGVGLAAGRGRVTGPAGPGWPEDGLELIGMAEPYPAP